ncbi:MAG TPA: enoyl-CoA hydratase-related protein [Pyrinomonadaceae bacterium]|nr:enoyl-CoA hydratase-related protein [Pyrinomonadaceae bacterium]
MMRDDSNGIVVEERDVSESGARICVVRLNRPAKRNALTRAMLEQLTELFRAFTERADLRAVILTGTGQAAFCAGTDISELEGLDGEGALATARRGQETCEAIELCGVPVIAAVNGLAAGGGCELALACHLRVAAADATFSLPELKLGMIPAYGGTQRLARAVGNARALAVMLAGDSLTADEALRLGLVNRVVAVEQVLAEASALARTLSELAPLALRSCLQAVTRGARLSLPDGLALEAELFSQLFSTEDVREGTRAFLEKRAPSFKGK